MESAKHLYEVDGGNSINLFDPGKAQLKSESFFSIFYGVLELWKKILKTAAREGGDSTLSGLDRVKHMAPTFFITGQKHLCSEILESQ